MPAPYLTSAWGYANRTLTDPTGPVKVASDWGTAEVTLHDKGVAASSPWGYVQYELRRPHRPIAVLTATGLKYVKIITKTGTSTFG